MKKEMIIDILKSLTNTQIYAILLLGSEKSKPVKGKTWYQKELFLIANNIPLLDEDASFKADYMGPYSEAANDALDVLTSYNIIAYSGSSIKLTDFGKELFSIIHGKIPNEQIEIIEDFKELLNDLDYYELLGFVYFTYPNFIDESLVYKEVLPIRKKVAMSLYTKEKISMSKAAEIADMPIKDFMELMKSMGAEVYSE
jgi:Uncharacterised protein family (UPF0175).